MNADLGQYFDLDRDVEQVRGINATVLLRGRVSKSQPCYYGLIVPRV